MLLNWHVCAPPSFKFLPLHSHFIMLKIDQAINWMHSSLMLIKGRCFTNAAQWPVKWREVSILTDYFMYFLLLWNPLVISQVMIILFLESSWTVFALLNLIFSNKKHTMVRCYKLLTKIMKGDNHFSRKDYLIVSTTYFVTNEHTNGMQNQLHYYVGRANNLHLLLFDYCSSVRLFQRFR